MVMREIGRSVRDWQCGDERNKLKCERLAV